MIERTDTRYTAVLRWLDRRGRQREERHVGWSAGLVTRRAYRRARRMFEAGEARCWRILHLEEGMVQ